MAQEPLSHNTLKASVYVALFCALIIVGGYISIPIGPVPIAFADFFVMMAALFLGSRYAVFSVLLFLLLGFLGLPVFAGGKAGLAVLFGPTGGFLPGYLLLAAISGALAKRGLHKPLVIIAALIVGNIALYAVGVPWLKFQMGIDWSAALALGLAPFIPGILIKIALATLLALPFASRVFEQVNASDQRIQV